MKSYSYSHLCDDTLLRHLTDIVARDRTTTAEMLALIAEVDERKLYLPAACPSMFAYCVQELRLSEDAAYKRIQAARSARRFPLIFEALADGRLNLTSVVQLTPHLTEQTADELVAAAAFKTKSELAQLLAERFPRTELLSLVEAVPASTSREGQLVPEPVGSSISDATPTTRTMVEALAPQRFALHLSIGQGTHELLQRAQELLSHQIPSGDVAAVIHRALQVLVAKAEKRKLGATARPQRKPRPTKSARHIPAHVKRAVCERDGEQCTFVAESGRRCTSRTMLEFDHVEEVARGGSATMAGMRLRCRAHNQYTAERTFGAEFMRNKRHEARKAADDRKMRVERRRQAASRDDELDVTPWLRQLGFRADEARRAAEHCESMTGASLEERVRAALSFLAPRARSIRPLAMS